MFQMKTIRTTLFFAVLALNTMGQTNWYFAKQAYGLPTEDVGNGIVDKYDNIYVTGSIICFGVPITGPYDTAYFGTYPVKIQSNVASVSYLAKYDDNGKVIWVTTSGGDPGTDADGFRIASDTKGNIYETGIFGGVQRWGTWGFLSRDTIDAYMVKYNSNGAVKWAIDLPGIQVIYAIATDNGKNIYLTGLYRDTMFVGSSYYLGDSNSCTFIAKFDSTGKSIWVQTAIDSSPNEATGLSIDASNHIYISGTFKGSHIAFGTQNITQADTQGVFIVKYDTGGNVLWAKSPQGFYNAGALTNCIDRTNNLYLAGQFDSIHVDPYRFLNPARRKSMYIAKFDTSGKLEWVNTATGTAPLNLFFGGTYPYCITTDTAEQVYVSCSSGDTITMGSLFLSTYKFYDPNFYQPSSVMKLDSNGNPICGIIMPCGGDDENAVAIDKQGNVIYEGDIENTDQFGPYTLTPTNGELAFIIKFSCDVPNAIEPISGNQESISVYPNPFSSFTTITFGGKNETHYLEVDDITGRKLKFIECHENEYQLSRGGLAAGVYILKVYDNTKQVVANNKIVVY